MKTTSWTCFLLSSFDFNPTTGTWELDISTSKDKQKISIIWSVATVINQLIKNEPELTSEWKISRARKSKGTGTSSELAKVSHVQVNTFRAQGFRCILLGSFLVVNSKGGSCKLAYAFHKIQRWAWECSSGTVSTLRGNSGSLGSSRDAPFYYPHPFCYHWTEQSLSVCRLSPTTLIPEKADWVWISKGGTNLYGPKERPRTPVLRVCQIMLFG